MTHPPGSPIALKTEATNAGNALIYRLRYMLVMETCSVRSLRAFATTTEQDQLQVVDETICRTRTNPEVFTMEGFISRGFRGRQRDPELERRLPPGQYATRDFPVLSAGPTPRVSLDRWDLRVTGEVETPGRWTWDELLALPRETFTVDIHCVTKWSKFDTEWEGVSVDTLLGGVETNGKYLIAHCDGGYTTNLPIADVTGGKAWVAYSFGGDALEPEHGGPARLLVPHLYFWKSAKWVRRLELVSTDQPGFWEQLGYHNYGDPWKEQRYQGD